MDSADMIRVIEKEARQLVSGLIGELKTNLGTSHYRRLGEERLFERVYAVYRRLARWLVSREEAPVLSAGEESGRARFSEGIPLGQVVLALILMEKHLWEYLGASQPQAEENLRRLVTEFFEKTVYSTAQGYEEALAVSNRLARRALVPSKMPEPVAPPTPAKIETTKVEHDLEVSRGGQVGEFGG